MVLRSNHLQMFVLDLLFYGKQPEHYMLTVSHNFVQREIHHRRRALRINAAHRLNSFCVP